MNTIKEQFYKTTGQYFKVNYEHIIQSQKPEPEVKRLYIKEDPIINYKKIR